MAKTHRPGAHHSDRAGEIVLGGTFPHNIATPHTQRDRMKPLRLISWRVNRWLGVESVEVCHG